MSKRHTDLPPLIHDWLLTYDAWLVGSAVRWVQGGGDKREPPRDYDVVICDTPRLLSLKPRRVLKCTTN